MVTEGNKQEGHAFTCLLEPCKSDWTCSTAESCETEDSLCELPEWDLLLNYFHKRYVFNYHSFKSSFTVFRHEYIENSEMLNLLNCLIHKSAFIFQPFSLKQFWKQFWKEKPSENTLMKDFKMFSKKGGDDIKSQQGTATLSSPFVYSFPELTWFRCSIHAYAAFCSFACSFTTNKGQILQNWICGTSAEISIACIHLAGNVCICAI